MAIGIEYHAHQALSALPLAAFGANLADGGVNDALQFAWASMAR
jgi:hypothetical protein